MQPNATSKTNNAIKNLLIPISIVALSLIIGLWLSQKMLINDNDARVPPNIDATVLANARPLVKFSLIDQDNQIFSPAQLKDQWSILFFAFTNCPDVCPTTLKVMQSVWKTLPTKTGDTGHPKFYLVSVDPERDTAKILKQYVQYFNSEFNGVTGKLDELDKLTDQIGIFYGYDDKGENDKEYSVNHSAQLILIDPKARIRAIISPPFEAKTIASNFQTIRVFYGD